MRQNLEWQLCALRGQLPGQGAPEIAFATAPSELQLSWWEHPKTHPTFPCNGNVCDPGGFTVGDVFFAEVATAYAVCANRAELFRLEPGERWTCHVDRMAYRAYAARLMSW